MNREIKFRIWDIVNKRWCNDGHFYFHWSQHEAGKEVMQQYSGIKDKNGNEIFEGDIIKFMGRWDEKGNVLTPNYEPYTVEWIMGGLRALRNNRNKFSAYFYHNDVLGVGHTDCEIIGNIFESPALFKQETVQTVEEPEEDLDLKCCPNCSERAWDGYICHDCGFKNIGE